MIRKAAIVDCGAIVELEFRESIGSIAARGFSYILVRHPSGASVRIASLLLVVSLMACNRAPTDAGDAVIAVRIRSATQTIEVTNISPDSIAVNTIGSKASVFSLIDPCGGARVAPNATTSRALPEYEVEVLVYHCAGAPAAPRISVVSVRVK